jgi:hypothetical protein
MWSITIHALIVAEENPATFFNFLFREILVAQLCAAALKQQRVAVCVFV